MYKSKALFKTFFIFMDAYLCKNISNCWGDVIFNKGFLKWIKNEATKNSKSSGLSGLAIKKSLRHNQSGLESISVNKIYYI